VNIIIAGLGGVGTALTDPLCRYLQYSIEIPGPVTVKFVDGDNYEDKNYERQSFVSIGNKASIKAAESKRRFDRLNIEAIDEYINEDNISDIITEGSIVFICVDNHASRKIISDHASKMHDVIIISGGNEFVDGNVQIYMRKGGSEITPSLTDYHPEIRNPSDRSPEEMSCEELSESAPQLLFTNLTVANIMCWVFFAAVVNRKDPVNFAEVYFDIEAMSVRPTIRKPLNR